MTDAIRDQLTQRVRELERDLAAARQQIADMEEQAIATHRRRSQAAVAFQAELRCRLGEEAYRAHRRTAASAGGRATAEKRRGGAR